MKIVILGAGFSPIPPPKQGGTEWIIYYQAIGLAKKGHQVILIAGHGSKQHFQDTTVKVCEIRVDHSSNSFDPRYSEGSRNLRLEMIILAQVNQYLIDYEKDYDLIVNNMRGEAIFLPLARLIHKPLVNIMHLPIFDELAKIFQEFNTQIITVSDAQRKEFPGLSYAGTVYNGIDIHKFPLSTSTKNYLLMIGSIGRHKNQGAAISVAKELGMKLILAGKIRDQDYFNELKEDIDDDQIKWIGEIGFSEKVKMYQNAKALLFPILWEEPFGLVMIEAMSCGTPVVAYGNGAAPEVIKDGETGFLVNYSEENKKENYIIKKTGIEGLKEAAQRLYDMPEEEYKKMRKNCRELVEQKFSAEKMVENYEKVYEKILK